MEGKSTTRTHGQERETGGNPLSREGGLDIKWYLGPPHGYNHLHSTSPRPLTGGKQAMHIDAARNITVSANDQRLGTDGSNNTQQQAYFLISPTYEGLHHYRHNLNAIRASVSLLQQQQQQRSAPGEGPQLTGETASNNNVGPVSGSHPSPVAEITKEEGGSSSPLDISSHPHHLSVPRERTRTIQRHILALAHFCEQDLQQSLVKSRLSKSLRSTEIGLAVEVGLQQVGARTPLLNAIDITASRSPLLVLLRAAQQNLLLEHSEGYVDRKDNLPVVAGHPPVSLVSPPASQVTLLDLFQSLIASMRDTPFLSALTILTRLLLRRSQEAVRNFHQLEAGAQQAGDQSSGQHLAPDEGGIVASGFNPTPRAIPKGRLSVMIVGMMGDEDGAGTECQPLSAAPPISGTHALLPPPLPQSNPQSNNDHAATLDTTTLIQSDMASKAALRGLARGIVAGATTPDQQQHRWHDHPFRPANKRRHCTTVVGSVLEVPCIVKVLQLPPIVFQSSSKYVEPNVGFAPSALLTAASQYDVEFSVRTVLLACLGEGLLPATALPWRTSLAELVASTQTLAHTGGSGVRCASSCSSSGNSGTTPHDLYHALLIAIRLYNLKGRQSNSALSYSAQSTSETGPSPVHSEAHSEAPAHSYSNQPGQGDRMLTMGYDGDGGDSALSPLNIGGNSINPSTPSRRKSGDGALSCHLSTSDNNSSPSHSPAASPTSQSLRPVTHHGTASLNLSFSGRGDNAGGASGNLVTSSSPSRPVPRLNLHASPPTSPQQLPGTATSSTTVAAGVKFEDFVIAQLTARQASSRRDNNIFAVPQAGSPMTGRRSAAGTGVAEDDPAAALFMALTGRRTQQPSTPAVVGRPPLSGRKTTNNADGSPFQDGLSLSSARSPGYANNVLSSATSMSFAPPPNLRLPLNLLHLETQNAGGVTTGRDAAQVALLTSRLHSARVQTSRQIAELMDHNRAASEALVTLSARRPTIHLPQSARKSNKRRSSGHLTSRKRNGNDDRRRESIVPMAGARPFSQFGGGGHSKQLSIIGASSFSTSSSSPSEDEGSSQQSDSTFSDSPKTPVFPPLVSAFDSISGKPPLTPAVAAASSKSTNKGKGGGGGSGSDYTSDQTLESWRQPRPGADETSPSKNATTPGARSLQQSGSFFTFRDSLGGLLPMGGKPPHIELTDGARHGGKADTTNNNSNDRTTDHNLNGSVNKRLGGSLNVASPLVPTLSGGPAIKRRPSKQQQRRSSTSRTQHRRVQEHRRRSTAISLVLSGATTTGRAGLQSPLKRSPRRRGSPAFGPLVDKKVKRGDMGGNEMLMGAPVSLAALVRRSFMRPLFRLLRQQAAIYETIVNLQDSPAAAAFLLPGDVRGDETVPAYESPDQQHNRKGSMDATVAHFTESWTPEAVTRMELLGSWLVKQIKKHEFCGGGDIHNNIHSIACGVGSGDGHSSSSVASPRGDGDGEDHHESELMWGLLSPATSTATPPHPATLSLPALARILLGSPIPTTALPSDTPQQNPHNDESSCNQPQQVQPTSNVGLLGYVSLQDTMLPPIGSQLTTADKVPAPPSLSSPLNNSGSSEPSMATVPVCAIAFPFVPEGNILDVYRSWIAEQYPHLAPTPTPTQSISQPAANTAPLTTRDNDSGVDLRTYDANYYCQVEGDMGRVAAAEGSRGSRAGGDGGDHDEMEPRSPMSLRGGASGPLPSSTSMNRHGQGRDSSLMRGDRGGESGATGPSARPYHHDPTTVSEREMLIRRILFSVLSTLHRWHSAGIAHGSLKGSNIFSHEHAVNASVETHSILATALSEQRQQAKAAEAEIASRPTTTTTEKAVLLRPVPRNNTEPPCDAPAVQNGHWDPLTPLTKPCDSAGETGGEGASFEGVSFRPSSYCADEIDPFEEPNKAISQTNVLGDTHFQDSVMIANFKGVKIPDSSPLSYGIGAVVLSEDDNDGAGGRHSTVDDDETAPFDHNDAHSGSSPSRHSVRSGSQIEGRAKRNQNKRYLSRSASLTSYLRKGRSLDGDTTNTDFDRTPEDTRLLAVDGDRERESDTSPSGSFNNSKRRPSLLNQLLFAPTAFAHRTSSQVRAASATWERKDSNENTINSKPPRTPKRRPSSARNNSHGGMLGGSFSGGGDMLSITSQHSQLRQSSFRQPRDGEPCSSTSNAQRQQENAEGRPFERLDFSASNTATTLENTHNSIDLDVQLMLQHPVIRGHVQALSSPRQCSSHVGGGAGASFLPYETEVDISFAGSTRWCDRVVFTDHYYGAIERVLSQPAAVMADQSAFVTGPAASSPTEYADNLLECFGVIELDSIPAPERIYPPSHRSAAPPLDTSAVASLAAPILDRYNAVLAKTLFKDIPEISDTALSGVADRLLTPLLTADSPSSTKTDQNTTSGLATMVQAGGSFLNTVGVHSRKVPTLAEDIWGVGILAIQLAEGSFPSYLRKLRSPLPSLKRSRGWSMHFCEFVGACLRVDPSSRPSTGQLLQKLWFAEPILSRHNRIYLSTTSVAKRQEMITELVRSGEAKAIQLRLKASSLKKQPNTHRTRRASENEETPLTAFEPAGSSGGSLPMPVVSLSPAFTTTTATSSTTTNGGLISAVRSAGTEPGLHTASTSTTATPSAGPTVSPTPRAISSSALSVRDVLYVLSGVKLSPLIPHSSETSNLTKQQQRSTNMKWELLLICFGELLGELRRQLLPDSSLPFGGASIKRDLFAAPTPECRFHSKLLLDVALCVNLAGLLNDVRKALSKSFVFLSAPLLCGPSSPSYNHLLATNSSHQTPEEAWEGSHFRTPQALASLLSSRFVGLWGQLEGDKAPMLPSTTDTTTSDDECFCAPIQASLWGDHRANIRFLNQLASSLEALLNQKTFEIENAAKAMCAPSSQLASPMVSDHSEGLVLHYRQSTCEALKPVNPEPDLMVESPPKDDVVDVAEFGLGGGGSRRSSSLTSDKTPTTTYGSASQDGTDDKELSNRAETKTDEATLSDDDNATASVALSQLGPTGVVPMEIDLEPNENLTPQKHLSLENNGDEDDDATISSSADDEETLFTLENILAHIRRTHEGTKAYHPAKGPSSSSFIEDRQQLSDGGCTESSKTSPPQSTHHFGCDNSSANTPLGDCGGVASNLIRALRGVVDSPVGETLNESPIDFVAWAPPERFAPPSHSVALLLKCAWDHACQEEEEEYESCGLLNPSLLPLLDEMGWGSDGDVRGNTIVDRLRQVVEERGGELAPATVRSLQLTVQRDETCSGRLGALLSAMSEIQSDDVFSRKPAFTKKGSHLPDTQSIGTNNVKATLNDLVVGEEVEQLARKRKWNATSTVVNTRQTINRYLDMFSRLRHLADISQMFIVEAEQNLLAATSGIFPVVTASTSTQRMLISPQQGPVVSTPQFSHMPLPVSMPATTTPLGTIGAVTAPLPSTLSNSKGDVVVARHPALQLNPQVLSAANAEVDLLAGSPIRRPQQLVKALIPAVVSHGHYVLLAHAEQAYIASRFLELGRLVVNVATTPSGHSPNSGQSTPSPSPLQRLRRPFAAAMPRATAGVGSSGRRMSDDYELEDANSTKVYPAGFLDSSVKSVAVEMMPTSDSPENKLLDVTAEPIHPFSGVHSALMMTTLPPTNDHGIPSSNPLTPTCPQDLRELLIRVLWARSSIAVLNVVRSIDHLKIAAREAPSDKVDAAQLERMVSGIAQIVATRAVADLPDVGNRFGIATNIILSAMSLFPAHFDDSAPSANDGLSPSDHSPTSSPRPQVVSLNTTTGYLQKGKGHSLVDVTAGSKGLGSCSKGLYMRSALRHMLVEITATTSSSVAARQQVWWAKAVRRYRIEAEQSTLRAVSGANAVLSDMELNAGFVSPFEAHSTPAEDIIPQEGPCSVMPSGARFGADAKANKLQRLVEEIATHSQLLLECTTKLALVASGSLTDFMLVMAAFYPELCHASVRLLSTATPLDADIHGDNSNEREISRRPLPTKEAAAAAMLSAPRLIDGYALDIVEILQQRAIPTGSLQLSQQPSFSSALPLVRSPAPPSLDLWKVLSTRTQLEVPIEPPFTVVRSPLGALPTSRRSCLFFPSGALRTLLSQAFGLSALEDADVFDRVNDDLLELLSTVNGIEYISPAASGRADSPSQTNGKGGLDAGDEGDDFMALFTSRANPTDAGGSPTASPSSSKKTPAHLTEISSTLTGLFRGMVELVLADEPNSLDISRIGPGQLAQAGYDRSVGVTASLMGFAGAIFESSPLILEPSLQTNQDLCLLGGRSQDTAGCSLWQATHICVQECIAIANNTRPYASRKQDEANIPFRHNAVSGLGGAVQAQSNGLRSAGCDGRGLKAFNIHDTMSVCDSKWMAVIAMMTTFDRSVRELMIVSAQRAIRIFGEHISRLHSNAVLDRPNGLPLLGGPPSRDEEGVVEQRATNIWDVVASYNNAPRILYVSPSTFTLRVRVVRKLLALAEDFLEALSQVQLLLSSTSESSAAPLSLSTTCGPATSNNAATADPAKLRLESYRLVLLIFDAIFHGTATATPQPQSDCRPFPLSGLHVATLSLLRHELGERVIAGLLCDGAAGWKPTDVDPVSAAESPGEFVMIQAIGGGLALQCTLLRTFAWHDHRRRRCASKSQGDESSGFFSPEGLEDLLSIETLLANYTVPQSAWGGASSGLVPVPSPTSAATLAAQLEVGGAHIALDGMFTLDDFEQFEQFCERRLSFFNSVVPPCPQESEEVIESEEQLPLSIAHLRHAFVEDARQMHGSPTTTRKEPSQFTVHESAQASLTPLVFSRGNIFVASSSTPSCTLGNQKQTPDVGAASNALSRELYASVLNPTLPAYKRHHLWQRQVRGLLEHSCKTIRHCCGAIVSAALSPLHSNASGSFLMGVSSVGVPLTSSQRQATGGFDVLSLDSHNTSPILTKSTEHTQLPPRPSLVETALLFDCVISHVHRGAGTGQYQALFAQASVLPGEVEQSYTPPHTVYDSESTSMDNYLSPPAPAVPTSTYEWLLSLPSSNVGEGECLSEGGNLEAEDSTAQQNATTDYDDPHLILSLNNAMLGAMQSMFDDYESSANLAHDGETEMNNGVAPKFDPVDTEAEETLGFMSALIDSCVELLEPPVASRTTRSGLHPLSASGFIASFCWQEALSDVSTILSCLQPLTSNPLATEESDDLSLTSIARFVRGPSSPVVSATNRRSGSVTLVGQHGADGGGGAASMAEGPGKYTPFWRIATSPPDTPASPNLTPHLGPGGRTGGGLARQSALLTALKRTPGPALLHFHWALKPTISDCCSLLQEAHQAAKSASHEEDAGIRSRRRGGGNSHHQHLSSFDMMNDSANVTTGRHRRALSHHTINATTTTRNSLRASAAASSDLFHNLNGVEVTNQLQQPQDTNRFLMAKFIAQGRCL